MPETDPAPAPESYGTPRWVKVLGTIALVIIALMLVLWLVRGTGGHGPARHMSGSGAGSHPEAPVAGTAAVSAPGRTA